MARKVIAGAPFKPRASEWNEFVDSTRRTNPIRASSNQLGPGPYIENLSGGDLDRFSVLGIDDVTYAFADNEEEFHESITFTGDTPTLADHCGKFVVLLEACLDTQFARCIASGVVQVQVDITDADHEWCDVKASTDTELSSYGAGSARILHKPSGTGVKWCLVNLAQSYGPATRYRGQQVGALLVTDANNGVDNLSAIDGVPVETGTLTCTNTMNWSADDNAPTFIEWNSADEAWHMYQVECPA